MTLNATPRNFVVFQFTLLISLGLISFGLVGCGGSEMSKLKQMAAARKAAGGNKPKEDDDKPKENKKADASKAKSDEGSAGSEPESSVEDKGNLTRREKQNIKSARSDDSDFDQFKARLLAKYAEKEKTLTQWGKYDAVARAFGEYVRTKFSYPPAAIPELKPTHSWRVALLPFLGYPELYEKFDVASRYNSPLNRRLIELMPPEYKTFDRKTKTTLVAPKSSYSAYWQQRGTRLKRLEDGISDTIGIVEVDDEHAVTWTQPADYEIDAKDPAKGMGTKRGFFVVIFGDGRVEKIQQGIAPKYLTAMISYDRGDSYPGTISSELTQEDFAVATSGNNAPEKSGATGSGKEGNPTRVVSSSPGTGSSKTTRSASGNTFSSRLREASAMALEMEDQTLAYNYSLASKLVQGQGGKSFPDFGWSKALQRPLMAVKWSAGIQIPANAKEFKTIERAVKRAQPVKRPGDDELKKNTGQIGQDAMIVLRKLIGDGAMGKYLVDNISLIETEPTLKRGRGGDDDGPAANRRNGTKESSSETLFDSRKKPFLHYSGIEVHVGNSRSYHVQVAKERGNELLLLFDVDLKKVGKDTMNITTMYVIDVERGRELWKSAPLNNLKIKEERKNALKKDAVFEELSEFDEFCRKNVALTTIPVALNRDNVLNRLKSLIGKKQENKLPYLAEAQFYLDENLILLDDFKKFCIEVIGSEKDGLTFAVGDPVQRFEIIKRYLPASFSVASK